MPDTIHAEISTKKPVVVANLTELRYLVFQGMIGETGQSAYELAVELGFEGTEEAWLDSLKGDRGVTLGWDVTDDGAGNVAMVYPDNALEGLYAVRYQGEQSLTYTQQAQARENIGAAANDALQTQGEAFAQSAAYLQALRRKLLGMTAILRMAYNTKERVDGVEDQLDAMAFQLPLAADANDVTASGSVCFARYNGSTLNTPFQQGATTWQQGMLLSFSNGNVWQAAAPIGTAAVFIRSGSYSAGTGTVTYGSWVRLLTLQDYTALDQRITNLGG